MVALENTSGAASLLVDDRVHTGLDYGMWFPVTEPWQYRVLDLNPQSLDEASLQEGLRMTPDERLADVVRLMEFADALRRAKQEQERK